MAGMTERIVEELSDDGASTTRRGFTLWLTGLSGAGKSTLGAAVQQVLASRGHDVSLLDGDQIRARRTRSIGFSKEDRDAHVLRVGRLANRISRKRTQGLSLKYSSTVLSRSSSAVIRRVCTRARFAGRFKTSPVSRRLMSRRSIPSSIFERTVNRSMYPLSGSSRLSRVGT
jgi:adenylylsulfate kinase-like enzyme